MKGSFWLQHKYEHRAASWVLIAFSPHITQNPRNLSLIGASLEAIFTSENVEHRAAHLSKKLCRNHSTGFFEIFIESFLFDSNMNQLIFRSQFVFLINFFEKISVLVYGRKMKKKSMHIFFLK
jgi:hypothetical protein